MKKGPVRIKDIAKKANVSTGTVDRVLHNRGRVSDDVRQKVLEIAKELNYEPNLLARALVTKKERHFAALIPDPAVDSYWGAPKAGIEKAESELRQYGVHISQFIFNPYEVASFREMADKVTKETFEGIIIAPIFNYEALSYFSQWKRKSIPFVLFNTHIPDYEPLMYIGQDSYQSGYLAAKLLHFKHKTDPATLLVAHIDEDISNSSHLIKKEQGFIDYFKQNTSLTSYQIVQADLQNSSDKAAFFQQMDDLLRVHSNTKGIFVSNSKANRVADYLDTRNLNSFYLIGYDLLDKNLHFLEKGAIDFLINQNPKGQGYWSVHGLADFLIFKKEVNTIKYLPLDLITKENLHYYIEASI
jgi:LacI family transcriptional regulator